MTEKAEGKNMFRSNDGPLAAVLSAAADAVVLIDDSGTMQQVSGSLERIFGYHPSECVGNNVSMLMPEPDRSAHDQYLSSYMGGGRAKIIGIGRSTYGKKKDGTTFPMHLSVGEFKADGRSYFVGICHDLTDYYNTLADLERAEKRYRDIIESQKYFICRLDQHLRVTFANASLASALDKSYEELIGQHLSNFLVEEFADHADDLRELLSAGDSDEINLQFQLRTSGKPSHAEWSFRRVESSITGEQELQGLGVDVTDRESALTRAQFLKDHDHLTGLLHGRSLLQRLKTAVRPGQTYAFLYFDPDRFGQVNQRYGHDSGDSVIVEMARRIKLCMPRYGLLGRLGGDELMVVAPVSGIEAARRVGERILRELSKPYFLAGEAYTLECKAGIALFPDDTSELSRMPELAEAAMRQAKWQNKSIVFFTGATHQELLRRIAIEQALKTALVSNSIEIYLQPKVSLAQQKKCGYEALARWTHDEWGYVSPAEFIAVAEAGGLGPAVDRYVIRKVAEIASVMRDSSEETLPIAVNITADHFAEPAFFDWLSAVLDEFGLLPSAIELEITEGVVLGMTDAVSVNFAKLRALGMRISIDDFGTGYSSLSYLKKLDVDELKIDKSFIDDIEDSKGKLLVQSMIGMARAYGLSVTAEGVETARQAELLVELGCDVAQGYLFSPALPHIAAQTWRLG